MRPPRLRLVCETCLVKVTQYITADGTYLLVGTDNRLHAVGRNYLPLLARGGRR